ncbi:MAG: CHAD domain-containing protein [Chloroflexi bacterium]|nr:MAG: CHAD domain-containing protein [Chloroflexota bacterium]
MDIEKLRESLQPLTPEDTMSEAGRKILLSDFIIMLHHEPGARTGENIEELHKMRVATRRMRSALQLLSDYYKPKLVKFFQKHLQKLGKKLGDVRDLDVMLQDLTQLPNYQEIHDILAVLENQRQIARNQLHKYLDSPQHKRFIEKFGKFLSKPGKGVAIPEASGIIPYQVRHILPVLIYDHLAIVRAYDTVLDKVDIHTLHTLRIEFKRLRYAISYFKSLLGSSVEQFIEEIKIVQDYLGRLNDIHVAQLRLSQLADHDILQAYISNLAEEEKRLINGFGDVWTKFNSRAVQRKLSDALLVLR